MKHFLFLLGFLISVSLFSQNHFGNQQIINQVEINSPENIDTGDIDGDNDPDLVCISANGTLSWFENTDGQGNYSPPKVIIDTIITGYVVKLADADGDGDADVLFTKRGNKSGLYWMENINSAGKFVNPRFICAGGFGKTVLTTDIDKDSNLDVLYPDGSIFWFEYDSITNKFEFRDIVSDVFYNDQRFLRQIDADHDGDQDLLFEASSIYGGGSLYLIPQDSSGGGVMGPSPYGSPKTVVSSQNYFSDAFAADMDSDGDSDIVYCNPGDQEIAWLENSHSQPNFTNSHLITDSLAGVYKISPADFDGDGDIDLAANSLNNGDIVCFENLNGTNSFAPAGKISAHLTGADELRVFDPDQDTDMDLLASARDENRISWYSNNGSAVFFVAQDIAKSDYAGLRSIYPADINGDQRKDVLVASVWDNKIGWYPNTSSGYGAYQLIADSIMGASGISAADIDNDGDLDVVATAKNGESVGWFENLDAQGSFGSENEVSHMVSEAYEVTPADMNGDGDIDLVVASEWQFLGWFENLGLGSFGNRFQITQQISSMKSIVVKDMDNDGDMDILPVQGAMGLFWFENTDGIGRSFTKQVIDNNLMDVTDVDVTDFDRDGDYDVLVSVTVLSGSVSGYNKIFLYDNDGNGNFASPVLLTGDAKDPRTCRSIDYDNDGDYDVVWSSFKEQCLYWIENQGQGNFSVPHKIAGTEKSPWELFVTDLNGDTLPDILASALTNDQISWYENLNDVGIKMISRVEMELFPNPTKKEIHIQSPEKIQSAVISDVRGRIVKSRFNVGEKNMVWDLNGLSDGIYLIRVHGDEGVFRSKIQKL
jgi:hypothetical protein